MARGKDADRRQVNVAVDEETLLALRLIAERDDSTVPEILRPVLVAFVDDECANDPELSAAAAALASARRRKRQQEKPSVTQLHRSRPGGAAE